MHGVKCQMKVFSRIDEERFRVCECVYLYLYVSISGLLRKTGQTVSCCSISQ